jgi:hypothetical protein
MADAHRSIARHLLLAALTSLVPTLAGAAGRTDLQLTHQGGWAPWSRTPEFDNRRQVDFELYNPATSAPDTTGIPAGQQLRWQVRCHAPGNPFVEVFSDDHAGRFPGGSVPGPGERRRIGIVFETTRTEGLAGLVGWSREPYKLMIDCTLQVGAFLPGPLPPTPGRSKDDYSPAPGPAPLQRSLIRFELTNDDSLQRPPDVAITALRLAGDASGRDPLEGGRNFFALLVIRQNAGLPVVSYQCDLLRDGQPVKSGAGNAGFGAVQVGVAATATSALDLGAQPVGSYEVRCRVAGVPRAKDADAANSERSQRHQVTVAIKGRGPDIGIVGLEVRDLARTSAITPTAGHPVRVHLTLENRGTDDGIGRGRVECSASKSGRKLHDADVPLDSPFARGSRRELAVNLPALDADPKLTMLCAVDTMRSAAGEMDPDLANNLRTAEFAVAPTSADDFRIEITSKGGWSPWSRTPEFDSRRVASFELASPSARGAATPSYAGNLEPRWQAQCVVTNAPWITVFDTGHIGRHPGGRLPAPGSKQTIAIGFENTKVDPKKGTIDDFRREPGGLQVMCAVRTGLFMLGQVPGGGAKSQEDYSMPPGQKPWWSGVVQLTIVNKDAR